MTLVWLGMGVLAIWLLGLTIVCAGLVRYVATLRLAQASGPPLNLADMDLEADGLKLGSTVPAEVQEVLARQAPADDSERLLFFLSPGCGICVTVGREAVRKDSVRDRSLFFVPGASMATPSVLDELLDALRPAGDLVVTTEDARAVMNSLGIHALPFVVAVTEGRVTHKQFVRREPQLQEFLDRVALDRALAR